MPSFGEKLKQEREKRKITLEEISVSTKIGTRMLQALEEDKFNQLPGGIFNKGFVRAYARFVGLDEDLSVADYLQASGDAPPPPTEIVEHEAGEREPAENIRRMEASTDSPSRPLPWGWLAAILLIVALVLSIWSHRRREQAKPGVGSTAATAVTRVAENASGTVSNSALKGASRSNPEELRRETALSPASTGDQPAAGSSSVSGGKAPSVPAPTPQNAGPQEAVAAGEFVVAIEAREESWVSITADGKAHSPELLAPGDERSIRGRKEVVVKLGNAGGVKLRFNGKKLDSGGEFGEVKTVTFGPGGWMPNAPAAPSTP